MAAYDLSRVIGRIVASAQAVAAAVRPGQAVEQYEAALERDMREHKLQFARQYPIGIPFDRPPDCGFYADFIVEGRVLLELNCVARLGLAETDLAFNYLRESGADICLLINFGRSLVEIRRILQSGAWSAETR